MLAVSTRTALSLIDASALKRGPVSILSSCDIPAEPTASTWASDDTSLFISTATNIYQHSSSETSLKTVYSSATSEQLGPISCLVSKEKGNSLIFSQAENIYFLEAQSGKILQTLDTHRTPVISLSLSNDSTLLASASSKAVHVHNLSLASHIVLRGLPSGEVTTCLFHPHFRTRLLLGVGSDLVIYDTTKPSGPLKVIPMDKTKGEPGDVVAIACSPFSKTFAAVACGRGFLNFLDIEKQKALYNTLDMQAPPTGLVFSPEGVMLYVGTVNGKLLVIDLRVLDKGPKTITISETGEKIASVCMQKKPKGEQTLPKTAALAAEKPLGQRDVNKEPVRGSAARKISSGSKASDVASDKPKSTPLSPTARTVVKGSPSALPNRQRVVSNNVPSPTTKRVSSGAAKSPNVRKISGVVMKKTLSPAKSPSSRKVSSATPQDNESDKGAGADLDTSVQMNNNLLAVPKPSKALRKENTGPAEEGPISSVSAALSRASGRTRTTSSSTTRSSASGSATSKRRPDSDTGEPSTRSSSLSKAGAGPTTSSLRMQSGKASASRLSEARKAQRTPSPDLPEIDDGRETPIPSGRNGKGKEKTGLTVLGLGSPEVDGWRRTDDHANFDEEDDRKIGKRVGFAHDDDDDDINPLAQALITGAQPDARVVGEQISEMAMQVSPRRKLSVNDAESWAAVPSPLRNVHPNPLEGSSRAQEFLQSMFRDAMYDFRQETHSELMGLHLDLIRMGQGWKKEIRDTMGEWRDEMKLLREENARLREENEILRRGY